MDTVTFTPPHPHSDMCRSPQIRPALSDSTEQLQRATAELAETSQLLQLVEQLLQLGRQLADSRRLQEAGRLTEAATCVSELRQKAQQLAEQTGDQVSNCDRRDQSGTVTPYSNTAAARLTTGSPTGKAPVVLC